MESFHTPSLAGRTNLGRAIDMPCSRWRCRNEDTGKETTIWVDRTGRVHSKPADPTTGPFAALAAEHFA